jgi:hypothetical protein
MSDLPSYDRARAFLLLVALFAIADTRRRERYCAGGCSHEWHQLAARPGHAFDREELQRGFTKS